MNIYLIIASVVLALLAYRKGLPINDILIGALIFFAILIVIPMIVSKL